MENTDILCLQEHWLLNYESHVISQVFPDCNYSVRCVDDVHPDLQLQRRKGNAGTAILWKRNLDDLIEVIPDGTDRTVSGSSEQDVIFWSLAF